MTQDDEHLIAELRQRASSGLGFASQATADLLFRAAAALEALSPLSDRVERLEAGLKVAIDTLLSVRIFVTSRQRVARPVGERWFDDRVVEVSAALADGERG